MPKCRWLPFMLDAPPGHACRCCSWWSSAQQSRWHPITAPVLGTMTRMDGGGIDRGYQLNTQTVLFKQLATAQGGGLIRQAHSVGVQPCKLAAQRGVAQRLFHGRVAQTEPLLQKMKAQHSLHSKRWTCSHDPRSTWSVRLKQAHQLCPRNNKIHFSHKHTFTTWA